VRANDPASEQDHAGGRKLKARPPASKTVVDASFRASSDCAALPPFFKPWAMAAIRENLASRSWGNKGAVIRGEGEKKKATTAGDISSGSLIGGSERRFPCGTRFGQSRRVDVARPRPARGGRPGVSVGGSRPGRQGAFTADWGPCPLRSGAQHWADRDAGSDASCSRL